MRRHPFIAVRTFVILCAAAAAILMARPAGAQGLGIGIGASADPDQFYFGGHYEAGPVADRVWFRPNVEVGVGDDLTLVALNFDFVYRVPFPRSRWRAYFGGGPALNIFHVRDSFDSEGGFNVVFGVSHRQGLFTEVKAGFIDSPSFKIGVGYHFGP